MKNKIKDILIKQIIKEHGTRHKFRIQRGVEQVSCFWCEKGGDIQDFKKFCKKNFISNKKLLFENFKRIERNIEILYGNLNRLNIDLKRPLHLDSGSIFPIDMDFGKYDPFAHLEEDLYKNKIAFFILLNFPSYSLNEKIESAEKWNRKEWSYARVGDLFISRIPSTINQEISEVFTNAETYISEYNIYMNNLVDNNGRIYFPEGLKLISHWGLRDEIKACYQSSEGLVKQNMIYKVMNRIIYQDIPQNVINSPEFKWNPYKNEVFKYDKKINLSSEPDIRYDHFLKIFKAVRKIDKYYPNYSTHIKRKFDIDREIPEIEVEKLFEKVLSSEQVRYTLNSISGKIVNWSFEIYDANDEMIMDINNNNQDSLGYDITVEKRPIQGYFSGKVSFHTTNSVQGDIFNGKEPIKVIFRGTIEDMNDYRIDFSAAGAMQFQEIK